MNVIGFKKACIMEKSSHQQKQIRENYSGLKLHSFNSITSNLFKIILVILIEFILEAYANDKLNEYIIVKDCINDCITKRPWTISILGIVYSLIKTDPLITATYFGVMLNSFTVILIIIGLALKCSIGLWECHAEMNRSINIIEIMGWFRYIRNESEELKKNLRVCNFDVLYKKNELSNKSALIIMFVIINRKRRRISN